MNDLRERLRRLGVKQGREGLKQPAPGAPLPGQTRSPAPDSPPLRLETLVAGREVAAASGAYFVAETAYPLSHRQGTRALTDVLRCDPRLAARLSQRDSLAPAGLARLAFFDIETTGLAGGTGTLAFLIGVGLIDAEADQFILRQFFLRDPAEEEALLEGVAQALQDRAGLVTYNGRGFDVPIVQTRFLLARRPFDLESLPNLDLLPAARRLWRGRYENCSLGTLEAAVLQSQRTEADVPGWLIPQLYVEYLQTGDAREMKRVLYHNAEDILSLAALTAHILEMFGDPLAKERSGLDCLRLALWYDDSGDVAAAGEAYQTALHRLAGLTVEQKPILYDRYAAFLKRLGYRAEAAPLWQRWADLAESDPAPCIELAKYYEWDAAAKDIAQAKEWASRALICVTHWPKSWQREQTWKEIQHRLERLGKKTKDDR